MNKITSNILTIIITAAVIVGIFFLIQYDQQRQEIHDGEIAWNATAELIIEIQTNGILPYFNSTGHLHTITFPNLCTQLNNTGGK